MCGPLLQTPCQVLEDRKISSYRRPGADTPFPAPEWLKPALTAMSGLARLAQYRHKNSYLSEFKTAQLRLGPRAGRRRWPCYMLRMLDEGWLGALGYVARRALSVLVAFAIGVVDVFIDGAPGRLLE